MKSRTNLILFAAGALVIGTIFMPVTAGAAASNKKYNKLVKRVSNLEKKIKGINASGQTGPQGPAGPAGASVTSEPLFFVGEPARPDNDIRNLANGFAAYKSMCPANNMYPIGVTNAGVGMFDPQGSPITPAPVVYGGQFAGNDIRRGDLRWNAWMTVFASDGNLNAPGGGNDPKVNVTAICVKDSLIGGWERLR